MRRCRRAPLVGAFLIAPVLGAFSATWSTAAYANAEDNAVRAQNDIKYVARELPNIQTIVARAAGERPGPETRLANGEMLLRTKDYGRAVVVLSEILEEFPDTASYPDALWLRAETYYASEQYLAARRDYRQLVDRGVEARFSSYAARALARLIDVSLRLNDPPEALQDVFDRLGKIPPGQVDAAVHYARGKALFRRQQWDEANLAFAAVGPTTPYAHQARYFQGLVALRIARQAPSVAPAATASPKVRPNFKLAIDAFHKAVDLPPDTPEHKHVIDLAWLAIGRLFYESEQYEQATEAYEKLDRDSAEYDTMLYELGWVYVRLGDVDRAERALEVLAISDPGSPFIADGTLLRADLLLRSGGFEKALQLYESVRSQYDPMRARIESFLDASSKDVSIYYEKLAQQQLDVLDQSEALPAIALRWAREGEDGPQAFALIEDVNQCKTLIRQSDQIIEKLNIVVGAANRVQAFPELAAGLQATLGLANRLTHGRFEMARALDDEEPNEVSGEIASIRAERRELMKVVEQLPIAENQFAEREQSGATQWNHVSQELTRRTLEIDQLQASLNALRQMLRSEPQSGVTRDPNSIREFGARLDEDEHDFKRFREAVAALRREIEMGRAQIGLGDARFQNDAKARARFRDLVAREVELAAAGNAGPDGRKIGTRLQPVVDEARRYDDQVSVALRALESQVSKQSGELQQKIDTERQSLALYKARLEVLDGDAKGVVGEVAKRNFSQVRDRLRNIVLRADVGITEQAWEVREEEQNRVRNLQSERSRQEQLLDEELKEVRDDGVDPAPGGASP